MNKSVVTIVDDCENHQIDVTVFGWNQRQNPEVKMGRITHQNFFQIGTAKFTDRLQQECDLKRWRFVEKDESETSKSSFLDREFLLAKVG